MFSFPLIEREVINQLMAYHWPGNVRELENVVERALILSKGEALTFEDLSGGKPDHTSSITPGIQDKPLKLDEVMSQHIRHVLEITKGKVHGRGAPLNCSG